MPEVLARARAAGVQAFVSVGTSPEGWARQRRLGLSDVHLAFGLHPWWVDPNWEQAVGQLDLSGAVALGEIGLDRLRPDLERQQQAYRAQLELARQHKLPVVLHLVKAHDLVGQELNGLEGVVHSYSGSREQLQPYLERGLHISFSSGALRGGKKVLGALRAVPGERLLLETDAPDQSPRRGERNEPAFLPEVVDFAARARGEEPEVLARVTAENARRLFRL